jgi:hypothetical protein
MSDQDTAKAVEPLEIAKPDAARQRLRVWLKLLKTQRQIEAVLRERLRVEFNTTLPRFDVLAALYRASLSASSPMGSSCASPSKTIAAPCWCG